MINMDEFWFNGKIAFRCSRSDIEELDWIKVASPDGKFKDCKYPGVYMFWNPYVLPVSEVSYVGSSINIEQRVFRYKHKQYDPSIHHVLVLRHDDLTDLREIEKIIIAILKPKLNICHTGDRYLEKARRRAGRKALKTWFYQKARGEA